MNIMKRNRKNFLVSSYKKSAMFVIVIFLSFSFFSARAVAINDSKLPLDRRDKIFSVCFINMETGWIVGDEGLMFKTKDGGESWSRYDKVTEKALYDITFVGDNGWVVGQGGEIFYSCDGGISWKRQNSNSEAALMALCFLNDERGIAIGEECTILYTNDAGKSWEPYPLEVMSVLPDSLVKKGVISLNFYDIFFLDNTLGWIVGDNGIVLHTSNGGEKWEVLSIGLLPHLFSVFFKNDSEGFASSMNGKLLRSMDGGKNWAEIKTPIEKNLYKVFFKEDFGIVVGDNGVVLTSTDGGKMWEPKELSFYMHPPWLIDTSFIGYHPPEKAFICVGENSIFRILNQ